MHPILEQLIAWLHSDRFEDRQEATLQLMLLLELHTYNSREQEQYVVLLPDNIRQLVLTPAEQKQLIAELAQVVGRDEQTSQAAIGAIRSAHPNIAFLPLLQLIQEKHGIFGKEAQRQALVGVKRSLSHWRYYEPGLLPTGIQAMVKHDTFAWLRTLQDSGDPEIHQLVAEILESSEEHTPE